MATVKDMGSTNPNKVTTKKESTPNPIGSKEIEKGKTKDFGVKVKEVKHSIKGADKTVDIKPNVKSPSGK